MKGLLQRCGMPLAVLSFLVLPRCELSGQPFIGGARLPRDFKAFCKDWDTSADGAKNGIVLQGKVTVEAEEVKLHWTLDYKGPRSPLIILAPSIELLTFAQTVVYCYAEGRDGMVYEVRLYSPGDASPRVGAEKEWFLTSKDGKPLTGTITFPVATLAREYQKRWPEQFAKAPPPLRLRLEHKPTDRGERFSLDAWAVGSITNYFPTTKTIEIPLKRW
jgi:hypothetical protein